MATKTYVASSLWNLAGDPDLQADLLPSLVLGAVLSKSSRGIGEQITETLRGSTALRSKMFYRWATKNYPTSIPKATLGTTKRVEGPGLAPALRSRLALGANQQLRIRYAHLDDAEIGYWAEHWVASNRPSWTEEDWTAEFVPGPPVPLNPEMVIKSATETINLPAPADFLWGIEAADRKLMYFTYAVLTKNQDGLWDEGPDLLHTYRMGTGVAAFDTHLTSSTEIPGEFLPALPIRVSNDMVSESWPTEFEKVKKGFRRLTGSRINKLLETIEEHPDLDEMDHILIVPGVPLNTKNQSGLAYLYEFFSILKDNQKVAWTKPSEIVRSYNEQVQESSYQRQWDRLNVVDKGAQERIESWAENLPSESSVQVSFADMNSLTVAAGGFTVNGQLIYNTRIEWSGILEHQHVGNFRRHFTSWTDPLAKPGEYAAILMEPIKTQDVPAYGLGTNSTMRLGLFHQHGRYRYRMLEIFGLVFHNRIYGNKGIWISAEEALEDSEDSGFLVPLHYPTLMKMSVLHKTKLAMGSTYVVVNSYKRVKKKWWQTGIFKLVLIAASIAISIYTAGASLGSTVGLLGANATVGLSLGASLATAAMVGAIANGIAAVVLTTLISKASVALFGDKWGSIIGTIAAFVGMTVGTHFAATGNFDVNWGAVFRADNLLRMTESVGGAYSRWLAADTAEIYNEMLELGEEHKEALDKVAKQAEEILGMTNVAFDPMMLTEAAEYFAEPSETFLTRTLLTGSDIAELSHGLIEGFAELSLELPGFNTPVAPA